MSMIRKTIWLLLLISFISCQENKKATTPSTKHETEETLKTNFKNSFVIGAALNTAQIQGNDQKALALLEKEFNSITPENDMKWEQIHPEKERYNFDISDAFVALGQKNNMNIVGHTLVWHSQLAPWMHDVTDSTEMSQHIAAHIKTIAGRYKGKIDTWDVVNEALNEDGSPRESHFYKVMNGESYIEQAFKLAAEADPNAILAYNDYNLWKPEKRQGVIRLVKNLQSKGIKIDAVGMQAHWSLIGPEIKDIEESIIEYSKLGVQVMITELDVTSLPNPWDLDGAAVEQNYDRYENDPKFNPYPKGLSEAAIKQTNERYKDIFALFIKHQDKISRVTFWGVNDGQSWLNNWPIKGRTNYPLLFDRAYNPKPSYHQIIELTKSF